MVTAYILVQAEVGKGADVGKHVAGLDGILSAEVVTGPYDVIARADAESIDELGRRVLRRIQEVDGVIRTLTCPVLRR